MGSTAAVPRPPKGSSAASVSTNLNLGVLGSPLPLLWGSWVSPSLTLGFLGVPFPCFGVLAEPSGSEEAVSEAT